LGTHSRNDQERLDLLEIFRSTTGGKSTLTRELDGKQLAAPAIGKEICL
jgi:hypothetical protein